MKPRKPVIISRNTKGGADRRSEDVAMIKKHGNGGSGSRHGEKSALPAVIAGAFLIAGSVIVLLLVSNRVLLMALPIVIGVVMTVFYRHFNAFMEPDPESVRSGGYRRRRLVGGLIWSCVVGTAFARYYSVRGFPGGLVIGFGGATVISLMWALEPYRFLADTLHFVMRPGHERTGRIHAGEEEEVEDKRRGC